MKLYINFLQILLLPYGFLHTPKPFSDHVLVFPFNIENVVKLKYVLESEIMTQFSCVLISLAITSLAKFVIVNKAVEERNRR
jgi:hypothetical protein